MDLTTSATLDLAESMEPSSSGFKRTMVNLSQASADAKAKKQKTESVSASMADDGEAIDIRKDLLKQFMQLNSNIEKMLESL